MGLSVLLEKILAGCSNYHVHLVLVLLSGISPFIIFFMGASSTLDNSMALSETMHYGPLLRGSSLVSLTLIIPLLLDALINAVIHRFGTHGGGANPSVSTRDILTTSETIIFHCAMMLPVIMPFIPNTSRSPSLMYSANCAHQGMLLGIFLVSIFRFNTTLCPSIAVVLILLLTIVGSELRPFVYCSSITSSIRNIKTEVGLTAYVVTYGSIAMFLIVLVRCLLRRIGAVLLVRRSSTKRVAGSAQTQASNSSEGHREEGHMWFRLAYVLCILFWVFFKIGVSASVNTSGNADFANFGDYEMFLSNVPSIVFQFFFLILSMRMVRFDAISALVSMIAAKKEYVRYIR